MQTTKQITARKERKVILSTLWIFVLFNYVYADIFTIWFTPAVQKGATNGLLPGSVHLTQTVVLVAAILMETAMAMVLLSRVLPYRANRWANIIVGILQTASVALSLQATLFYVFFATIEIGCTLFIVWYAWTWPPPEGGGSTSAASDRIHSQQIEQQEAKRKVRTGSGDTHEADQPGDSVLITEGEQP